MNWESLHRRRTEIVLAGYCLFSLTAILNRWDSWVRGLRALLFYILVPSTLTLGDVIGYGANLWRRLPALASALHESQALKKKLSTYALLEAEARELRAENGRLRQILGLEEHRGWGAVTAQVIARDPQDWFSSIVIDRGSRDGVEVDAPVVAYEDGQLGLVGRVEEATGHSAKVLLISDTLSSVSVKIGQKGELAVLQGLNSYQAALSFISPEADMRPGDKVVTAGLGKAFPPGIPAAQVIVLEAASPQSLRRALATPIAPLSRLSEVMVLVLRGGRVRGAQ